MPITIEARDCHKLELAAEVLGLGGTLRLRAFGTSMLPVIWPGDVLTIEHKSGDEIVPGDIALVVRHGRFFVHRLIEKCDSGWITRGDSLPHNDEPAAESQVLGRVSLIRRKAGAVVPNARLSVFGRTLGWMLCHWDSVRNFALRIHSFRQGWVERRRSEWDDTHAGPDALVRAAEDVMV